MGEHDRFAARGVRLHVPLRSAVPGAAAAATATTRSDAVLPHVQLQPLLQRIPNSRMRCGRAFADATIILRANCVRSILYVYSGSERPLHTVMGVRPRYGSAVPSRRGIARVLI